MRSAVRRGLLGVAAAGLVAAAVLAHRALVAPSAPLESPLLSLLAVGDAGVPPSVVPALDAQRAVGRALALEDEREPVDAVVFLGDNFYEHGLARGELVERLRGNLVRPYCRFVELAGPRSSEVRDACAAGDPSRHRPPLYAVLGNHDTQTDESRELQTNQISLFVSNWKVPDGAAQVVELGSGVSLVLFDSVLLQKTGDIGPLRDALRGARGPWRVIAAHHPIGTSHDASYSNEAGVGSYGERVLEAIREAHVDVHLMLAGHEHNLQLLRVDPPSPHLVVVSGAGSSPKEVKSRSRARLFKHEGLGFARVDLVRDAFGERLAVTFYGAPYWSSLVGATPEVLARWSVRADGHLLREPIAVRSAGLL